MAVLGAELVRQSNVNGVLLLGVGAAGTRDEADLSLHVLVLCVFFFFRHHSSRFLMSRRVLRHGRQGDEVRETG